MLINMNWYKQDEIPMQIGHLINGEKYYMSDINKIKIEHRADMFAIDLIKQYCIENDIEINSKIELIQNFGIPESKIYSMGM